VKEFEEVGKEALESVLPFNELQLLKDNKHFIERDLKITEIEFVSNSEVETIKDKIYSQVLPQCVPGKAQIIFFWGSFKPSERTILTSIILDDFVVIDVWSFIYKKLTSNIGIFTTLLLIK